MDYFLHIAIIIEIYIILTLSLNLVVGITGLPAFGHAAFSCIGAYTSSLLTLKLGISPWSGIWIAGILAALVSIVVGISAIRLDDDYLALATIGLAIIVYSIAQNWVSLTRGPLGLPGIPSFSFVGYQLSNTWSYLILVTIVTLTILFVMRKIIISPFGRVLKSIREDELASKALGYNTTFYKLIAFIIGAFFAGIAGSLYAHYITYIDPSNFTIMESITILLMVIFGGMGSISGSIIGAALLVLVPEILRFWGLPITIAAPLRQMLYGFVLVCILIRRPQGIMGAYRFK